MWKKFTLAFVSFIVAYWFLQDNKLHTLQGKRVLVTGGSDGIGEQIAYHYARLGANVVVTARRLEKLNKVVNECQALSPSAKTKHFAVSADMSHLNDTKRVIDQAVKGMGGLDILVLNHVTPYTFKSFTGTQDNLDIFNHQMDVNFRSYVHLTGHAWPQLQANDGSIIVVSSISGKFPFTQMASYSASKYALEGFFGAVRNEQILSGTNVSVTSCILGAIGTESATQVMDRRKQEGDSFFVYKLTPYIMASPSDTALEIVTAGARRVREIYTPYTLTRPMCLLYGIWPSPVDTYSRLLAYYYGEKE